MTIKKNHILNTSLEHEFFIYMCDNLLEDNTDPLQTTVTTLNDVDKEDGWIFFFGLFKKIQ